jgi:hypothetical protein
MFALIKGIFGPKHRAVARYLGEEARRRGITVDELTDSLTLDEKIDLVERVSPGPDLSAWGMVARAELTERRLTGVPAIDDAVAAAWAGNWTPAAEVLASSYGEWDYRAMAVVLLAEVAAHEDASLTAWRASCPDDRHFAAVDCESLMSLAWQLRGTALAEDTPPERFAHFHRVLGRAEKSAMAATELLPGDPTPWATLATVARGLRYDHADFDRVWRELVERAPHHRYGHVTALQYWCARWAGSDERMWAFAEEAAATSPPLNVLVLQAARESDAEDAWRRSTVRDALDELLRWLNSEEGASSVHAHDDLGWAAMALVNSGRAAEAVPLFQRLGRHAGGAPWRLTARAAYVFNSYRDRACKAAGKPR